ncbi:MAG TPA: ATP-binding protein [Candidatus Bilamarchaeaceae archaeon]|nr:ATP-binding protein [Candidatus Bilamarchaeaceae archaeon]
MSFIDRKEELKFLEERYPQGKPQFIVIYGRRRVGKTELIKEFSKEKKAIYFLAEKGNIEVNFERFSQRIAEASNQEGISFKGWKEAFEYLKKQNKKWIIAIDEFPYLIQSDPTITSKFQTIADEIIRDSSIYLILCGSSISMMEDDVLAYKSPLYGRRTGQWQLNPLSFRYARLFFPKYDVEKQIEAYAVGGGIPLYLQEFDDKLSVMENIKTKILSKGCILYEEPKFVLNQEFNDAKVYFSIFEALANGKTTIKELSDGIGVDSRNLNKYLNALMRLHYVSKNYPLLYEKNKKKARYSIKDNFFDFWFRFVNPNFSDLEMGDLDKIEQKLSPLFNSFVGKKFEQVAEELLRELNKSNKLPFSFDRIANFWDNTKDGNVVEIDRIAVNTKEKKLLVVECKWESGVSAKKLLAETQEKVNFSPLFEKYEIHYAFFAKSFKNDLKEDSVLLFDLKGMEKSI